MFQGGIAPACCCWSRWAHSCRCNNSNQRRTSKHQVQLGQQVIQLGKSSPPTSAQTMSTTADTGVRVPDMGPTWTILRRSMRQLGTPVPQRPLGWVAGHHQHSSSRGRIAARASWREAGCSMSQLDNASTALERLDRRGCCTCPEDSCGQ